jgi:hypothetical protein
MLKDCLGACGIEAILLRHAETPLAVNQPA